MTLAGSWPSRSWSPWGWSSRPGKVMRGLSEMWSLRIVPIISAVWMMTPFRDSNMLDISHATAKIDGQNQQKCQRKIMLHVTTSMLAFYLRERFLNPFIV